MLQCRFDEARKQRMRVERARLQFRVVLDAYEPRMIRIFDRFRQDAVRRHAGENEATVLDAILLVDVDFLAVAVSL